MFLLNKTSKKGFYLEFNITYGPGIDTIHYSDLYYQHVDLFDVFKAVL